jgi:hypothetical protein
VRKKSKEKEGDDTKFWNEVIKDHSEKLNEMPLDAEKVAEMKKLKKE